MGILVKDDEVPVRPGDGAHKSFTSKGFGFLLFEKNIMHETSTEDAGLLTWGWSLGTEYRKKGAWNPAQGLVKPC